MLALDQRVNHLSVEVVQNVTGRLIDAVERANFEGEFKRSLQQ